MDISIQLPLNLFSIIILIIFCSNIGINYFNHFLIYSGGWSSWSPLWMCGPALKGSTVGIVGLGRVGLEVAKKLKSFNVGRIVYSNRTIVKEGKYRLNNFRGNISFCIASSVQSCIIVY